MYAGLGAAAAGDAPVALAQEGVGPAGGRGGLGQHPRQVGVAVPGRSAALALAGGLLDAGGELGPGDQVPGGREPGHVHAKLGEFTVDAVAPPLLLALVGGLAVNSQDVEAVFALGALDQVFLLERAAHILCVGVKGVGRIIAVQVIDIDGDLLAALLRLGLVHLPDDERGDGQHKDHREGNKALLVVLFLHEKISPFLFWQAIQRKKRPAGRRNSPPC